MDKNSSPNSGKGRKQFAKIATEGADVLSLLAENEALRTRIVEIILQCEELRERERNLMISCH